MKHKDLKHFIKESITDWLKERKTKEESVMSRNQDNNLFDSDPIKEEKPSIVDQIAEFYYVTNPTKESKVEELIRSGDIFEFAQSGLTREDIHGIFKSENKAKTAANKVIKERDFKIKETIKKVKLNLKKWNLKLTKLKVKLKKTCLKQFLIPI